MNSGQVWLINRFWGRRSRKALGRSPGQGLGGLYRGKDAQRDTVFRGLSGASLPTETIYMHSPHWGRWATGGAGAISPQRATPAPTSASSQICTVCGLLFTGRRPKWPVQSPGWKKFRRGGSSHTQFLGPQLRVSRQRVVPTLWGDWPVQPSSSEAAVSSAHAPWYQPLASTQRGDQHEERLPPTLVSREATLELNKRSHSLGLGPPHPQLPKSHHPQALWQLRPQTDSVTQVPFALELTMCPGNTRVPEDTTSTGSSWSLPGTPIINQAGQDPAPTLHMRAQAPYSCPLSHIARPAQGR